MLAGARPVKPARPVGASYSGPIACTCPFLAINKDGHAMDGRTLQLRGRAPALPVRETMSMQETGRSAISRRQGLGRARWLGAGLAVTVVALGAGLAVTALPAYADVTSSDYTIGTPTGAVTAISATPAAVTSGASTQFKVTFTTPAALAGSTDS